MKYELNLTKFSGNFKSQIINQIKGCQSMNTITLKNFKSYENQSLSNLNSRINLVIGRNGQGKSNFFKAFPFCLTDKVKMNKNQFNSYAHRGRGNQNEQIEVSIIFKEKKVAESVYHKFERIWESELVEHYKANDRHLGKGEYQNFIEAIGLSYSNPYNIIQQGKITQITLMDEYEIYKLLEQATGLKRFQKKQQQALEMLKKTEDNKKQIKLLIEDLENKFKIIESKRGQFEFFYIQEKAKKAKHKISYQHDLHALKDKLAELKSEEGDNAAKIKKLKLKTKEQQNDLEDVEVMSKLNEEKIKYYLSEDPQEGFLPSNHQSSQMMRDANTKMKANQKKKDGKSAQLKKKMEKLEELRNKIKPFKEKYQILKTDYDTQKKLEGGDKGSAKKLLVAQIQGEKESISNIQAEILKLNKIKSEMKIQSSQKDKEELTSTNESLNLINNEVKNNKIEIIEKNRLKNHLQAQIQVCKSQKLFYANKLKKCMPLLDFNLTNLLQKQNVKGVYGYLIQFIEIQPQVAFAYEIAGLARLCSLLVEDEAVCSKVISCNKQNKGKQINILPINYVKKQPNEKKNYPENPNCFNLLNPNWIKIKEHSYGHEFNEILKKIIMNTFNKHVLVKDYDLGLQISKEYHLTSITSEREIIYSEGYLCKVGHDEGVEQKLDVYRKFEEKNYKERKHTQQLTVVLNSLTQLQNQELQIIRKQRYLEEKHRQIQIKLNDIAAQKRSFDRIVSEQTKLQESKGKYLENIKRKESQLSNLEKKKAIKVSVEELKQTEKVYTDLMNSLNKLTQQVFQIEESLIVLTKEDEKAKKDLEELELDKELGSKRVIPVSSKDIIESLKSQQKKIKAKKEQLFVQMKSMENELKETEEHGTNLSNKICLLEDEQKHLTARLEQIGPIQANPEQLEQLSHSFSMNRSSEEMRRNSKPHHFSVKDKMLFSKFVVYCDNFKAHKTWFNEIQEAQLRLNELIQRYQSENQEITKEVVSKFEKQFDKIFKRIVQSGKTQVRCKKVADKTKTGIKYKTCLNIRVSFDASNEVTKKWNDFSGGQKTVIAISMLMALQKCQPAPFYIFDQVDSALDKQYVQKIASIILQQSEFAQYFITSFKAQMMSFPSQVCNFYVVKNEERVSKIKMISKEEAQSQIEAIAN